MSLVRVETATTTPDMSPTRLLLGRAKPVTRPVSECVVTPYHSERGASESQLVAMVQLGSWVDRARDVKALISSVCCGCCIGVVVVGGASGASSVVVAVVGASKLR